MTLFSRKILSASGVVGPLAPSAMILSGKRSETPADTSDQLIGRENIQNNNLGLDPGGIVASELLLSSSWDQDVAVSLQNVPIIRFGAWEAHDGAVVLRQEPWREQNETNQQGGGLSRKAAVLLPACSPPAVWGRCHQGCRWIHQSPPRQHTWLQTCAGTSWSEDPHYQSPERAEKERLHLTLGFN